MKTLRELADLIAVRNHLSMLISGTRRVIKKGEVGKLSAVVDKIDMEVLQESMNLMIDENIKKTVEDEDITKKIAEAKAKMAQKQKDVFVSASEPAKTAVEKAMTKGNPTEEEKPKKSIKRAPVVKRVEKDIEEEQQ